MAGCARRKGSRDARVSRRRDRRAGRDDGGRSRNRCAGGDDYRGARGGTLRPGAIASVAREGGARRRSLAMLPGGLRRRAGTGAGAARTVARSALGHEVARADLQMRGPGDLLGARQTGALPLRFAGFIRDYNLIQKAGDLAEEWLAHDSQLTLEDSAGAREALARMLDWGFSLGDVG